MSKTAQDAALKSAKSPKIFSFHSFQQRTTVAVFLFLFQSGFTLYCASPGTKIRRHLKMSSAFQVF